jgi:hypothetical protein
MSPLANKTRKTIRGEKPNHVARTARRPIWRSRTKSEHARTLAAAPASGPKRPTLEQEPKAGAGDFNASPGELLPIVRHSVRRPRCGDFYVGLPEAVGRNDCHLTGAAAQ